MTMIERISTLVRANINDLLDRAEDPEKVIKQLLMDMHSQLLQAKTQVAAAIADEKRLFERYQDSQFSADEWQQKAERAVASDDDDLARQALMRRAAYQQTADSVKAQHEAQAKQVEVLKEALGQLEAKIDEAEAKKDLLIARSRRAQTETRIRTSLSGTDASGALANFERMEQKVDEQEARAAALHEIQSDALSGRFAALEATEQVERELAELKAQKAAIAAQHSGAALPSS